MLRPVKEVSEHAEGEPDQSKPKAQDRAVKYWFTLFNKLGRKPLLL